MPNLVAVRAMLHGRRDLRDFGQAEEKQKTKRVIHYVVVTRLDPDADVGNRCRYYESEGIEQRRPEPDRTADVQTPSGLVRGRELSSFDLNSPKSLSDLQLRPSNDPLSLPGRGAVGSPAQLPPPPIVPADSYAEPSSKGDQGPVIGHMGRLVSDDRQVAMFAGSSTGVHFISQAEQQLQMLRIHNDAFPSCTYSLHLHHLWDDSAKNTSPSIAMALVSKFPPNTVDILQHAIDEWTPMYPVVHKQSTLEAYSQLLVGDLDADGTDDLIVYQLLLLLALGSLGGAGDCAQTHHHFLCASEKYYLMSEPLLNRVLARPCLQTLQGLVLVQIYLQLSSRYSLASHLGGVATRLAQTLGLHRHSQRFKFDPLETELRRRVWWCQYTLDALSSAYHGMPRLIRDHDVDTDLPTCVDHDLLSRSHVAFPLPGETSQVDTALLLFKLARIVGGVLESLYTTTQRRRGVAKIARFQAELNMWERSLPEGGAPAFGSMTKTDHASGTIIDTEMGSGGPWSGMTVEMGLLRAAHCVATIHIHRPALSFTTADPQFLSSLQECGKASAELIRLLSSGLGSDSGVAQSLNEEGSLAFQAQIGSASPHEPLIVTLLYPIGAHMLWQAGLTVMFARWKGHSISASDEVDRDIISRCSTALRSIHAMTGNGSGDIIQCADVLDLLAGKTFSGTEAPMIAADQLQWNMWDWPMASALELTNSLDAIPFDITANGL